MALNWFDFADKDDIRAARLYSKLLEAKTEGWNWDEVWVKVKTRDLPHFLLNNGDDQFWTGRQWVKVFTYQSHSGRLYARLPLQHEEA